jgi:hypothetical protein
MLCHRLESAQNVDSQRRGTSIAFEMERTSRIVARHQQGRF